MMEVPVGDIVGVIEGEEADSDSDSAEAMVEFGNVSDSITYILCCY